LKNEPHIKVGQTVRIRVLSGETVEGKVLHIWEQRNAQMIRIESEDRVYNLPAHFVIAEKKAK
jgi:hypothetical protein